MARDCPICAEQTPLEIVEVFEKQTIEKSPLRLATCQRCGFVFQPTTPTREALSQWYAYMGANPVHKNLTPLLRRRLSRTLELLTPYRRTGKVLDLGSGGGLFLRVAQELGWLGHGVELSETAAPALEEIVDSRLHVGPVEEASFGEGEFDAIVMLELIEHLADPAEVLRLCRRWLRPGGALLVTTPNYRGVSGRLRGTTWRAVDGEHLSYFVISTLSTLLNRTGFETQRLWTSGVDLSRSWKKRRDDAPPTQMTQRMTLSSVVVDLGMQAANVVLRMTSAGDTIKAIAT